MLLPRPIKKILAILRGSVAPPLIFLSVTFGFTFGLVPGFSGLHVLLIIIALVLNIHTGLFLLFAAIGKGLCFAAAPLLYHTGQFVQAHLPWLLKFLAAVPLAAITDYSRYAVAGAVLLGPVAGALAGLLLARIVISFRKTLLKFEESSDAFKKWYSNRWVRTFDRLLVGKRTKDAKALFTGKTIYIRKAGIVLAAIVLAASLLVLYLLDNETIRTRAETTLTKANDAEVDLESLSFAPLAGSVAATGIQITDAENPASNRIAVEKLAADASIYHLLLGKFVLENVELSNVRFDETRDTPGTVATPPTEKPQPIFNPEDFKLTAANIAKLETYFKNAKDLKEKLQKLSKWLPKPKESQAQQGQVPERYLEYLNASAPLPPTPRVLAKNVLLDKVQIPSVVLGSTRITLKNLSNAPRTAGLPITAELKSLDTPTQIDIDIDFDSPDQSPTVSGTFSGLELATLQQALGDSAGIAFQSGRASGTFNGRLTNQDIDLTIDVNIKDLKATAQGKGILGLGADNTSQILDTLRDLNTTIRIVGPVTEPRLAFDTKGLAEQFKQALAEAGKQRLMQEVDSKLTEQLGDKLPEEARELVKPEGLLKDLGSLLDNKKDQQQ